MNCCVYIALIKHVLQHIQLEDEFAACRMLTDMIFFLKCSCGV